jgi:tetratricopeptide (TPR) repeat protein
LYSQLGDSLKAAQYFDSALVASKVLVNRYPENATALISLASALAATGDRVDAIRQATFASELVPISGDALRGPETRRMLAGIFTYVGEQEQAINELRFLLSIPSGVSRAYLGLDPLWDPLRDNSEFKQLLSQKETVF